MSIFTVDIGPWRWAEVLWVWMNQRTKESLSIRDWQHAVIKGGKRQKADGCRQTRKQTNDRGSINAQPGHGRGVKRFKVVENLDLGERKVVRRRRRIYRRVDAGQKQAPT